MDIEANIVGDNGAFEREFGSLPIPLRLMISYIKNNVPIEAGEDSTFYILELLYTQYSGWELLGRYIANNNQLKEINGEDTHTYDDHLLEYLFRGLTRSSSIERFILTRDEGNLYCMQSMVPFFQNSPKLSMISLNFNFIYNEGFELLVNALDGGPIEFLFLNGCRISDIAALENCALPKLRNLALNYNEISNMGGATALVNLTTLEEISLKDNKICSNGCTAIGNLLRKGDCSLKELNLYTNNIDDEGAEILANSLKHNTTLSCMNLQNNRIDRRGLQALLKLLNDVSSIGSTYNSNHTLRSLELWDTEPDIIQALPELWDIENMQILLMRRKIEQAITVNCDFDGFDLFKTGRAKIIHTHLNSTTRKELAHMQGIEYCSLISEIDNALVLPEILELVAGSHGRDELYSMLKVVVPDLASIVNREAVVRQNIVEKSAQIEAMRVELANLKIELVCIEEKKRKEINTDANEKL